jgi:hypothetical protein
MINYRQRMKDEGREMAFDDFEIAHHNYDVIFKAVTERFKDNALEFYGVHVPPIVDVEPTELSKVEINTRKMDFVFRLADGTYLHLEFQTSRKEDDLLRFLSYDVGLYTKKKRNIRTVVIYGADVEEAPDTLSIGSVNYQVQCVFMSAYDGDAVMQELWHKVRGGDTLTEIDQLNLIFMPLMRSKVDRSERAIEAVKMAESVQDEVVKLSLLGSIIGITARFIDKEYVRRMVEVLRMNEVYRELFHSVEEAALLKGKVEAKRQAIRDFLHVRFGLEAVALNEQLDELVDLAILDALLLSLYRAPLLPEAEKLMQDALRVQEKKLHK